MAFIKEIIIFAVITVAAYAQLPILPDTPELPVDTSMPELPAQTNGTIPVGETTTQPPNRFSGAINAINGMRGKKGNNKMPENWIVI